MERGVNLGRAQRTQQLHSTEQKGEWHCCSLILSLLALIMCFFLLVGRERETEWKLAFQVQTIISMIFSMFTVLCHTLKLFSLISLKKLNKFDISNTKDIAILPLLTF